MTIVYVTNVIDEVLSAERILILDEGQIKYEIKRNEIIENVEKLKGLSLEMPVIMDVIVRLKERNINIDPTVLNIEQLIDRLADGMRVKE
jgi:energy-coupling factor transport system ATP-binding protein